MTRGWPIGIGAAALPLGAAQAQDAAQPRDTAQAEGQNLRVEALAGLDTDGYDDGAVFGARIGYDFRATRNLQIGIDGEFNDINATQSFFGSPIVIHQGPEYYVGGRATLSVSRRVRLFAGLGYGRARFGNYYLIDPNNLQGPVGVAYRHVGGLRTTLGGQFSIGRRAFLGAEYRFTDYSNWYALNRGQLVGSIGFRF